MEALEAVMGHLGVVDLAALACTGRFFRALAARMTPGLRLSLYPHQVRGGPGCGGHLTAARLEVACAKCL